MSPKIHKWHVGLILLTLVSTGLCEEDSLQSALSAIDRKQRDLWDYPKNREFYSEGGFSHYNYEPEENDELAFLSRDGDYVQDSKYKTPDFERGFYDYVEEEDFSDVGNDLNKRISSSFRERVEEDKARQREKLTELLLNKIQDNDNVEDMDQYAELMQLWDEYNKKYSDRYDDAPREYYTNDLRKRYYTNFQPVGMKRGHYFESEAPSESLYFLNYDPQEEIYEQLQDPENVEFEMAKQYASSKRFPVTKRSSNYYPIPYSNEVSHYHKRSPKKESAFRTDPKVAKDLSNIFSPKSKRSDNSMKERKEELLKKTTPTPKVINNKKQKTKPKKELPKSKETIPVIHGKEEPLQIEKKSIDWSNYFGLDRRKKSDDIDDEWLMERYHKAVAMAAKRNSDSKLKSADNNEKTDQIFDEAKISEIDSKLKSMEDSILDKTLKFTGAHEGAVDSKEIQEVKDRIISQLAAAYNMEKMRRALGEYGKSIERQRSRMKEMPKEQDHLFSEEKRLSVPRKSAVDETRQNIGDADNNIKCTQEGEGCNDQNYRVPSDLIEQVNWDREPCPKVQKICHEVSSTLGHYGRSFGSACVIHQNCLICVRPCSSFSWFHGCRGKNISLNIYCNTLLQGDNKWYTPIHQCTALFLAKADEICDNDIECQRFARHSIRYLNDISRSMKAEPMESCNLVCPEKRR